MDGEYKDEAAFILITELVSVRSNMYSPIKDGDKGGKTAKGIKKNVFKKNINMKTINMYYLITSKCIRQ